MERELNFGGQNHKTPKPIDKKMTSTCQNSKRMPHCRATLCKKLTQAKSIYLFNQDCDKIGNNRVPE